MRILQEQTFYITIKRGKKIEKKRTVGTADWEINGVEKKIENTFCVGWFLIY